MERFGREGESAAADSGKVNIISNLLILLEWLGVSALVGGHMPLRAASFRRSPARCHLQRIYARLPPNKSQP